MHHPMSSKKGLNSLEKQEWTTEVMYDVILPHFVSLSPCPLSTSFPADSLPSFCHFPINPASFSCWILMLRMAASGLLKGKPRETEKGLKHSDIMWTSVSPNLKAKQRKISLLPLRC